MKVLHVLGELNPSGAETMLRATTPFYQAKSVELDALSTGETVGSYGESLSKGGVAVHHIPFSKSGRFFLRFHRFLARERFDVVHIHTERACFWLGIVALFHPGAVVRTVHSVFPFKGNLRLRRKLQRQILKLLGMKFIAISESVQSVEREYYGLDPKLIANWYDSLKFVRTTVEQYQSSRDFLGISNDVFTIVSVGNCSKVKNHQAIIESIAILKGHNILYLHVGVESSDEERLLAEQLGVGDRVRFYGMQTDILPFLKASDLFVMPSLHEGFGVAAIEAIATGIPSVLSDVAGLSDFKGMFKEVVFCQPTAEELANAIRSKMQTIAFEDGGRKETESNTVLAKDLFGAERAVNDHLELYCG